MRAEQLPLFYQIILHISLGWVQVEALPKWPVSRLTLPVQTDLDGDNRGGRERESELGRAPGHIKSLRGDLPWGSKGVVGVNLIGQDLPAGLGNSRAA